MTTRDPSAHEDLLNKEHLEMLASLSEDEPKTFISELLATFNNDWETHMETIENACLAKDSTLLSNPIHKLNGSSSNLGLHRLHKICLNIEEQIHAGTFSDFQTCSQQIKEAYKASTEALSEFLKTL